MVKMWSDTVCYEASRAGDDRAMNSRGRMGDRDERQ